MAAYELRGTRTKNIVTALQSFVDSYCRPPYVLTTDGGPQFGPANAAITSWCVDLGICHEISAAFSPSDYGESESAVKRFKAALAHADMEDPNMVTSRLGALVSNINLEQRLDKSGCAAELFL